MKRYSIWDIDNCLSDDGHRMHLIDWHLTGNERYERYNRQMHADPVIHKAEFDLIAQISEPVFLTGRPEKFRHETEDWLWLHLGVYMPPILMRGNDDRARPADLKRAMLSKFMAEFAVMPEQIVVACDDVEAIVTMYREVFGIPAVVLRQHDPALAYNPDDLKGANIG